MVERNTSDLVPFVSITVSAFEALLPCAVQLFVVLNVLAFACVAVVVAAAAVVVY